MDTDIKEQEIRRVFTISVWLKALHGVLEVAGGMLLFFSGLYAGVLMRAVGGELIEDPTDFAATILQHYMPYLLGQARLFAAFYLVSHGVLKVLLAAGLLRRALWAYPAAIAVFLGFIAYQLYRFTFTHSPLLIFLSIFDVLVVWLTWHEYRYMKSHTPGVPNQ